MARGDQIYVIRELINLQGVYEHHGIDCGDGSVIHMRKRNETIERTSIESFAEGKKIYIRHYPVCLIADVVVRRAETRLGESKYNLLFYNCEHFATWCKTGVSQSQQIKDFVPMLDYVKVENLSEPIKRSLLRENQKDTTQLLDEALAEIEEVWDRLQPRYNQAMEEMNLWQRVATEALKRDREDLARAALKRKLSYKQRATKDRERLNQLATLTETLLRNHADRQPSSS